MTTALSSIATASMTVISIDMVLSPSLLPLWLLSLSLLSTSPLKEGHEWAPAVCLTTAQGKHLASRYVELEREDHRQAILFEINTHMVRGRGERDLLRLVVLQAYGGSN